MQPTHGRFYRAHVPIRNSKFLKLLTFQMPKFPLVKNLRGKNSLDFPFLCTCRVTLPELQSRNSLTTELHTLSVPPASFTRASLFRLGFPCFRFGPAVAIGLQAPQGGRRASSRQETGGARASSTRIRRGARARLIRAARSAH